MMSRSLGSFVKIALLSALSAACAAESPETAETGPPHTVTSAHALYGGSLLLQPAVGYNFAVLELVQADGERVVGAAVAASLRMPDHGHFSSQMPICVESSDGRYEIVNLVFDSQGSWRLDVTVAADPGLDVFEFPVNVD